MTYDFEGKTIELNDYISLDELPFKTDGFETIGAFKMHQYFKKYGVADYEKLKGYGTQTDYSRALQILQKQP